MTTETRSEGPETITTTVEEWEVPVLHDGATGVARAASESSATSAVAQSVEHRPLAGREAVGSTPIGGPLAGAVVLVKRTVTVDQRGPILDTKRQTEKEASSATQTVQAEAKSATVVKTSYSWPLWLWGGIVAVGIALFAAIRLGLKLPFGL